MEKAVLMMDYLNVTQGAYNNFSHKGDCALDIAGKDGGRDDLRAPFTGTIKKIYSSCNAVWLESNSKVKYADGTEDYMTLLICHDNSVTSLYVGKVVNQGQVFYQEGTKGYATGNHIHLTISKGKFTGSGWHQNEYGTWVANNQYLVHKGLFLDSKTKIINDGGYNWIKTSDYAYSKPEIKPEPKIKYLNLDPVADSWTVYKTNKYYIPSKSSDVLAKLNPMKYGGLTYEILEDKGNYHFKIKTDMFGIGYISGNINRYPCSITDKPKYEHGCY